MNETNANMPQPTELISAEDARALTAAAKPGRSQAEADTLATNALRWAMRNAEGQTSTRIRTYAMYGRTSVMLKFAPGETDCAGAGNAFYNDLLANSNVLVADAISSIIHGRPQGLISPLQEMRLLNEYNAKLVAFLRRLRRAGYDVKAGEELASEGVHDNSTVVVSGSTFPHFGKHLLLGYCFSGAPRVNSDVAFEKTQVEPVEHTSDHP